MGGLSAFERGKLQSDLAFFTKEQFTKAIVSLFSGDVNYILLPGGYKLADGGRDTNAGQSVQNTGSNSPNVGRSEAIPGQGASKPAPCVAPVIHWPWEQSKPGPSAP